MTSFKAFEAHDFEVLVVTFKFQMNDMFLILLLTTIVSVSSTNLYTWSKADSLEEILESRNLTLLTFQTLNPTITLPPATGDLVYLSPNSTNKQSRKTSCRKKANTTKPKCSFCRRRLGYMKMTCRCGGVFCMRCRDAATHNCDFDYQNLGEAAISKACC